MTCTGRYAQSNDPQTIVMSDGQIVNDYTSDGRKLSSTMSAAGGTSTDMYIDDLILRNGSPLMWKFDGGIVSSIHWMFNRIPIPLVLYIGNIMPFGILFLISVCIATPGAKAWHMLFLIGWLIMSIIPVAVTSYIVDKKLNTCKMN